jgi:hypothetical protein
MLTVIQFTFASQLYRGGIFNKELTTVSQLQYLMLRLHTMSNRSSQAYVHYGKKYKFSVLADLLDKNEHQTAMWFFKFEAS